MTPCPPDVARAIDACPPKQSARLSEVRALILETAAKTDGVGPLTETLKWGEPAYLTERSKSGSTLRIGPVKGRRDRVALFVNCQTRLADRFRDQFGDRLHIEGDRAVLVEVNGPVDHALLAECIALTLTYRLWR
ncbi:DUF1801 domain-containing protein [Pseudooceanicola sp. MF1-13]|uniref:DUF1801 domain-containing protein n=1 Tax=Pseudooceanicola sp. MF1-13 TaxID=3379095 RepID=UPI0038919B1D